MHKKWFRDAEAELRSAVSSDKQEYYDYKRACCGLHMSVEKAFKGLLIFIGIEPEHTHNIDLLLDALINSKFEIPDYVEYSLDLMKFAPRARYATEEESDISDELFRCYVKIASDCVLWAKQQTEK